MFKVLTCFCFVLYFILFLLNVCFYFCLFFWGGGIFIDKQYDVCHVVNFLFYFYLFLNYVNKPRKTNKNIPVQHNELVDIYLRKRLLLKFMNFIV